MNRTLAVLRTEAAIEDRQMLVLDMLGSLDRPSRVDMADDLTGVFRRISQLEQ